jgi:acyl dehydratase
MRSKPRLARPRREVRWLKPVRPGAATLRAVIGRSETAGVDLKPDHSIVTVKCDARNVRDEPS